MHTVDEVIPLLGSCLDEHRIESLFGLRGQDFVTEFEPGHPDDQRRYYLLPTIGLQFLLNETDIIETIFFVIEGDNHVGPYMWSFRNGVNPSSSRKEVLAALGQPDRSRQADTDDPSAPGGWDRFRLPTGLVHVQYKPGGVGVSMVTVMQLEFAQDVG
jgi:hypothetical protein